MPVDHRTLGRIAERGPVARVEVVHVRRAERRERAVLRDVLAVQSDSSALVDDRRSPVGEDWI